MQKPDQYSQIEDALKRLMPVGLTGAAQAEIESQLDELCGGVDLEIPAPVRFSRWVAALGIAAALVLGFVIFPRTAPAGDKTVAAPEEKPGFVLLNEEDRVEGVSDEGLFVDSGGSAVRKVRVRVVGESSVRDEETGIVVTLAEPREEMYLVPVNNF